MMISGLHQYNTPLSNKSANSPTPTSATASTNGFNPNDFMTLLVAEIQNQDPTNPMDPTTFMTQLVQLNQLEQVTDINQVVQEYAPSTSSQ